MRPGPGPPSRLPGPARPAAAPPCHGSGVSGVAADAASRGPTTRRLLSGACLPPARKQAAPCLVAPVDDTDPLFDRTAILVTPKATEGRPRRYHQSTPKVAQSGTARPRKRWRKTARARRRRRRQENEKMAPIYLVWLGTFDPRAYIAPPCARVQSSSGLTKRRCKTGRLNEFRAQCLALGQPNSNQQKQRRFVVGVPPPCPSAFVPLSMRDAICYSCLAH